MMKSALLRRTLLSGSEKIMIFMIGLIVFTSCVQSPNSKRSVVKSASTADAKNPTKLPDFKSGVNYIQNGVNVFNTTAIFDISFSDSLVLRGKDVDTYIRTNGTQNVACLSSRFVTPSVSKIILTAAIPRSVYNFTTQTLEYYYNLLPADSTTNQSFCQKTGLLNQLFSLYPALTPKYKMSELCPGSGTCLSTYNSESLQLFSASGAAINQIATAHLNFSLTNQPSSSSPGGLSCMQNAECTAQGYSCCSLGQCVKDLALKPGVDTTSTDYTQALQDILNNPANIYNYPQYYFICSSGSNSPTSPETPSDPMTEAAARLEKLKNLYNCTNKIEGEYGLCTKVIKNAQLNTFYYAGVDDRSFKETFTHLTVSPNTLVSIEEVSYGEVVLFHYAQKSEAVLSQINYDELTSLVRIEGIHNDDLASGSAIKIKSKPPGAINDDLVIRYKVDASCTALNSSLAKCEKYFIQGQSNKGDTVELNRRGRVTDHYPDSNIFKLPYYVNTSRAITVEVDGILQRQGIDWQLRIGNPSTVEFLPLNTLKVFKDQKVKISFFSSIAPALLMPSKMEALAEIKSVCGCNDYSCSLTPVKNTSNVITDYACVFPDPAPTEPPLSQKIYLSSKTVPVRYFDSNGTGQSTVNANTLPQEGGTPFDYRKDNLLNPNNLPDINTPADTTNSSTNYFIGFNEIYGSLSYSNNSAKPAREVAVKKGQTYDIYVDRGVFSNCIQCGNDYYSNVTKLFPLAEYGGGIVPLQSQTNRLSGNTIRADEMAFGRACLVPATMIPWTHHPESEVKDQRLGRMRAQHFAFANGYQYDWYGFDYGAVIGSFDGVKWFAIGTNRRIKADTNKLFIAVNGLFGDLTIESTYEVSVIDATMNPNATNMVTKDFDSDGAQCQRYHQCLTDTDCTTTLGWDYACAPVNQITTSWPKFDDNAKEIPETSHDNKVLTSILGVSSAGKRCVYRGRGSLCTPNYQSVTASTFNESTEKVFHACSANNYCQPLATNGTANNKFNNRIARYGKVKTDTTIDSFGFGARVAGRPYNYHGLEAIRSETLRNYNSNKALAMCLPGKNVETTTFVGQNQTAPSSSKDTGDKVLGLGMTYEGNTRDDKYLMSCSIMDSTKNLHSLTSDGTVAKTAITNLKYDSGTQAMSTNALSLFKSIFATKKLTFNILKNNSELLNGIAYSENRCLRAPGSSCFSDMDCAASKPIADKIRALSADDATVTSIINKYEVKFWQEELICSQETLKSATTYDPKNNRCCRDVGKTISIASSDTLNPLETDSVAGIDINMNNPYRYSRVAPVYKEMKTDATNFPPLTAAIVDQCATTCQPTAGLPYQYKTFSSIAEKTSCTANWVRSFAAGTTKWEAGKFQKFNPKIFQCYNWLPGSNNYTCEGMEDDDPDCRLVQTLPSSSKARGILDYLGRLELMGVPQIALEVGSYFEGTTDKEMSCRSHPTSQANPYPGHLTAPIANYKAPTLLFSTPAPAAEYDNGTTELYSAKDPTNFIGMKAIFKADEVRGCYPAGTQMKAGDNPDLCCTGFINGLNNKCQLLDLVDVSVYTNRYISSEAKKLNSTLFDSNGYVKDPYYVAQLVCEKQICASGVVGMGTLITQLKTPGRANSDKLYRFLEGATEDNESKLLDLFKAGLKLNNHAYCLPPSYKGKSSADFTIISCGY